MGSPDNRGRMGKAALAAAVAGMLAPPASEIRVARPERALTDRWRQVPVAFRHATRLGISFRPVQAETFELDPHVALQTLLAYPFEVIRLGAYWNRIETAPGAFDPADLDWQVAAAEEAGKQIIICVGPVKTFGYPEYFVPDHRLDQPLPEGALVEPRTQPSLLAAASALVTAVVARYRDRDAVVAWQVEHEAVDPLGLEHSWRLSASFVGQEVEAARAADPTRPIIMNGFLPTSTPVRSSQWWRTRDQGDSLTVAQRLADVVGVDFYPRHAHDPASAPGPPTSTAARGDGNNTDGSSRRVGRQPLPAGESSSPRDKPSPGRRSPSRLTPIREVCTVASPRTSSATTTRASAWPDRHPSAAPPTRSGAPNTGCCVTSTATHATCRPSHGS